MTENLTIKKVCSVTFWKIRIFTVMAANRAKSQFLSQMSHEIRTPMNAIIGLNSIVLRDESISPHTREELEKSNASAQHLLGKISGYIRSIISYVSKNWGGEQLL